MVNSKLIWKEFPDGLMIRTWGFHCSGPGSVPCLGTGILKVKKKKS